MVVVRAGWAGKQGSGIREALRGGAKVQIFYLPFWPAAHALRGFPGRALVTRPAIPALMVVIWGARRRGGVERWFGGA